MNPVSRMTAPRVLALKGKEPLTMLTAYDYPTARLVDEAGIEMILVGDSLGNVVLGYDSTLPVTMEEMLHHCKAVARGAKQALLIGDLPFMSYQASVEQAVTNAGRFVKEGGMHAVKLEGGREHVDKIKAILNAGIPVQGHLGLKPQSVHAMGGYKVQGKTEDSVRQMVEDAKALDQAGIFSLVLEGVVPEAAKKITEAIRCPTIGIGAGKDCDGQVLVLHDLLGITSSFCKPPSFAKEYAHLGADILKAVQAYKQDVKQKKFP